MGKIDFDKFLIDYVNSGFSKKRMLVNYLLEPQGLQIVKDEIVPIKDNKEPRLKIENGKWYVCIRNLDDHYGTLAFHNGHTYYSTKDETLMPDNSNIPFEVKYYAEHYFRPWSIQDAKVGNIIVDCYNNVCIFKNIDNNIWQSLGYLGSYSNEFVCNGFHSLCSCHPATKKQCDLLFTKIREAGYEWNAEELKLEKIEQKQEWSEEDNLKMDTLIHVIINQKGSTIFEGLLPEEFVSWIKSIKERVQPKVELTQLDKNILEAAIAFVEQNNHFNCWRGVNKHTVLSALHSLKPQTAWKPSDEQMEALRIARDRNDRTGSILSQLYDDLKKLM